MIIQHVLKGIGGISEAEADGILENGILCNCWRTVGMLPEAEVKTRLTGRNLHWHQNNYDTPDPLEGGDPFRERTPFISTTARSVERDALAWRHIRKPALAVALEFATDNWARDAFVCYCYLFVLGRPSVAHRQFSEEIRELHMYDRFSPFQPEGEITAKLLIPATQIEKYEYYELSSVKASLAQRVLPKPTRVVENTRVFAPPEDIANVRGFLT